MHCFRFSWHEFLTHNPSCPQESKAEQTAEGDAEAEPSADADKGGEEEIDIDLDDPEVAQAATKIQASFRGHKTRKEMSSKKVWRSYFLSDCTAPNYTTLSLSYWYLVF